MRRPLITFLAAAVTGVAVVAQQPAQEAPLFRAGANVVAVDAVVLDKNGRFVLDLTAKDFQLTEDGKPKPIDQLFLVRGKTAPARSAPATTADAPFAPPPPSAPAPRVFIAVFDDDHLSPGGFKRIKQPPRRSSRRSFSQATSVGS